MVLSVVGIGDGVRMELLEVVLQEVVLREVLLQAHLAFSRTDCQPAAPYSHSPRLLRLSRPVNIMILYHKSSEDDNNNNL